MTDAEIAGRVLEFWFGDAATSADAARARAKLWFSYDAEFDAEIARRFDDLPDRALRGELDAWTASPSTALARIIVLDQFPRNLYRDDARAFAYDALALRAATDAVTMGFDRCLHPLHALFAYLPFEHAEDARMQERSVALFEQLRTRAPPGCEQQFDGYTDYARRHRDVIARFGRFPHRNAVLNRADTPEETQYLQSGGARFGPKKP